MKKRLSLFLILCMVSMMLSAMPAIVYAATQATYYVNPVNGNDSNNGTTTNTAFMTIQKARDTVRTINSNMTGDIIVYLMDGTFSLSGTLEFNESDSGTNGYSVIYRAYPDDVPVISGGKTITGWSLYDAQKNIYRASVSATDNFRQLYVNGMRATRAKSAGVLAGYVETSTGYTTTDTTMHNWGNKEDIEFVYQKSFEQKRAIVSGIAANGATDAVTMLQPYWDSYTSIWVCYPLSDLDPLTETDMIYIENAYELLDQQGEWYHDNSANYVYYIPKTGENMATATVVAPVLDKLVEVRGMLNDRAEYIQFDGIQFSYATLNITSTIGYNNMQSGMIDPLVPDTVNSTNYSTWRGFSPKPNSANVRIEAANNISFSTCNFIHLGSAGLDIVYAQNCSVSGSTFTDISGSAIQVLGYINETVLDNPDKLCKNNYIYNNSIHDVAVEYQDQVGIFVGYTENTVIAHNEIYNVPYDAITMGWGWGSTNYTDNGISRDNKILYNKIHDYLQVLSDGGGIYTEGLQSGSLIKGNYLYNQPLDHSQAAYYLDNGTSNVTLIDNVCANVPKSYMFNRGDSDNYLDNMYSTTSNCLEFNGDIFNPPNYDHITNVTVYDPEVNTPTEAQAIIDNAGIPVYPNTYTPDTSQNPAAGWKFYNDNTMKTIDGIFNKFTYTGANWSMQYLSVCSCDTIMFDEIEGQYATFKFYGTQVKWYSPKRAFYGIGAVSIDGGAETNVDLYSATDQWNQPVWTSSTLSAGEHTLRIRVTRTKNASSSGYYVLIDGVQVYNADSFGSDKYYNDDTIGWLENNNQLNYVGTWYHGADSNFSRGYISLSETTNDYLTYTFSGTQVKWYSPTRSLYGKGAVSIDNGAEIIVDLYSETDQWNQLVWTSPTLSNGVHTIKIRVTGTNNVKSTGYWVLLDGLQVSNPGYQSPTYYNDSVTGTGLDQFNFLGYWYSEYSGSYSGGTIKLCETANNYMTFLFNGTQIKWWGFKSSWYGIAAVSIDGGAETLIDCYGSNLLLNQLLWTSPILQNGQHTLKIRITGTRNPSSSANWVIVDGVQVIQ